VSLRPQSGTIPDAPGSYQFKDKDGRVIYVGKAKSLRSRLNSYFGDPRNLHQRTAQMVATAASVEWVEVDTEVDALMLEYSLIQQHQPRFNVRLRDDKSYPFLAVTLLDDWPRAMVIRGKRKKGNRYFGPFGHAYAIRETLDLLLRTFPIRTCSDNKLQRHQRAGRPCLLFHIEKCAAPCVDEVSKADYDDMVKNLISFLAGDHDEVVEELEASMAAASDALEFELAARYRDRLSSVNKAIEKQQIAGTKNEDFDIVGVAGDELEAAAQVFFVRKGRVAGQRGFVIDKVEPLDGPQLSAIMLERLYHDDNPLGMPKAVFVAELPESVEVYEEWLTFQRGSNVEIRVPQRGEKRALHETVTRNATELFKRHRLKRASDHNTRARALSDLQKHLKLPEAPLRIECYDMSHLQGTDYVGSMVVFEDGLPKNRDYRRFKIKSVEGNDDFAAMEEVLTRRLTNYLEERDKPAHEQGKFAYPPQLLLVDGGKGQLSSVVKVLDELGLRDQIPVASLAKQFEEVYLPEASDPVSIPRQSEALYLLQRLRDESHRFAISYHRQLRAKRMTKSILDDIAGLGEKRKLRLIKELGGVGKVKVATLETLHSFSWLPDAVGQAVYEKVHAVNASRRAGPTGKRPTPIPFRE